MDKRVIEAFGSGFVLWLIGYALGIALFFVLPPSILGWVIMPIGSAITVFVSLKIVSARTVREFLPIALAWTVIAVALDYIFIVKLLNPPDGYYKLDVYLYYVLTFIIPMIAGAWKERRT